MRKRTAFRRVSSAAITVVLCAIPVVGTSPAWAYSSQQWALDYLKATADWQLSKGSNVTVAVLDSGVASIPDLGSNVIAGADFSSGTTTSGDGKTDTDDNGHGTGMASIIAGNGTAVSGLAPAAKILPVRIDASSASGLFGPNIAASIRYAVSQHVGVINLSIGGQQDLGPDVSSAIAQAVAANIVVVAATGNQDNGSTDVQYPAAYPGVIAVGAIDQSGQIWSQSSYGPRTTLVAPGVQIYRDNNLNQQGTESGTSEAAAYVSATAALVRSAHPDWTAGQVIRDLIGTADPASGQTAGQHSDQYGYGTVDPLKALRASAPSDTSNPLLASTSGGNSTATPATTPTSTTTAAAPNSSHTGLIIGIVVGVVVIVGLILLIVALARRGRGGPKPPYGPGPGQPGQYGGGGYQQSPYAQQHPYGQQPPPPQPPQRPQR